MNENIKRNIRDVKDIPSYIKVHEHKQEEYAKLCKVSFDDIPDYIPRSITIGEPTTPKTLKFCFPNGDFAEYKMDEQGCKDLQDFLKRMEQHTELEKQLKEYEECLIAIRDRGTEKDFDCLLSADIVLQKWGVK